MGKLYYITLTLIFLIYILSLVCIYVDDTVFAWVLRAFLVLCTLIPGLFIVISSNGDSGKKYFVLGIIAAILILLPYFVNQEVLVYGIFTLLRIFVSIILGLVSIILYVFLLILPRMGYAFGSK